VPNELGRVRSQFGQLQAQRNAQQAQLEALQRAQLERLRQIELARQERLRKLYAAAIDMSEAELRAALKSKSEEERFVAAYVVGERRLRWPDDLIPLLKDKSDLVRQAARRSLIILSFLELNPEEAALIASPNPSRQPTPLDKLKKPVDFGPHPEALSGVREAAAKKWTEWWADRDAMAKKAGGTASSSLRTVRPENLLKDRSGNRRTDLDDPDRTQLADVLLSARSDERKTLVAKYRDTKGVQFTEALAEAISRSPFANRPELRDALADRMVRMKDSTLRDYLADPLAEIRRAAALGLAKRGTKSYSDRLADLLVDPDPLVGRAAHTALCQLSGEDFGPDIGADDAERADAVARWKKWSGGKK
jgi:hypothetical protein